MIFPSGWAILKGVKIQPVPPPQLHPSATPAAPTGATGPLDAFQRTDQTSLPDLARAARLFRPGTEQLWTSQRDGYFTPPSTAPDGTVLAGHSDRHFYGIDPQTGATRWTCPTDSLLETPPAVGRDGRLYATGRDRFLYILAPTGAPLRRIEIGLSTARPTVDAEGRVFVATVAGQVKALDPEGELIWEFQQPGRHERGYGVSPVPGPDGTLFCVSEGGIVTALDPVSGQSRWSNKPGFGVTCAGVASPDGHFLVPGEDGTLHCLDGATGAKAWSVMLDGPLSCSPVLSEGRVWALPLGGQLTCLRTSDGGVEWTAEMGGTIREDSPVLGPEGLLFANDEEKSDLVALDASTGHERWRLHLEGTPGPGTLSPDGSVLYLKVGSKGLAAVPTRTLAQRVQDPGPSTRGPEIRQGESHVEIGGGRLPRRSRG